MSLLKITFDDHSEETFELLSYSTDFFENASTKDTDLILKIFTPKGTLQYRIYTDEREPDIKQIKLFISNLFDNAMKKQNDILYKEFLVKEYLQFHVSKEDKGVLKTFSAQKI